MNERETETYKDRETEKQRQTEKVNTVHERATGNRQEMNKNKVDPKIL